MPAAACLQSLPSSPLPQGSRQSLQHTLHPQVPPRPGFNQAEVPGGSWSKLHQPRKPHFFRFCVSKHWSQSTDRNAWVRRGVGLSIRMWPWPSSRTPPAPLPSPDLLGVSPCVCHEAAGIGRDTGRPWHQGPGARRRAVLYLCDSQRGLHLVPGQQQSACSLCVCR